LNKKVTNPLVIINKGGVIRERKWCILTIEVALLISVISVAFGIWSGVTNIKRNEKNDTKADATELTTVIVKLENIGNDISEIKNDMKNVKDDMKDINIRLVKMEQQVKVLNKAVFKDDKTNE